MAAHKAHNLKTRFESYVRIQFVPFLISMGTLLEIEEQ